METLRGTYRALGPCSCKRGFERDNCPQCEGGGVRIDFQALRNFSGTIRGTKRSVMRAPGDYRVVCAMCGAGGTVKHASAKSADNAAVRLSAQRCRTCGLA